MLQTGALGGGAVVLAVSELGVLQRGNGGQVVVIPLVGLAGIGDLGVVFGELAILGLD